MCHGAPVTGIVGCFHLIQSIYFLIQEEHIRLNAYNWQILLDPESTTWSDYEETIRSINHILYISCDQSHSVKTSYTNRLTKTFRLFSRLCENCNIKNNVHSQLLLYMTPMSSYIWFSRWLAYIYNYFNTLYCTCTKWLYSINTMFHSLSNDWLAGSVFTSSRPVVQ